MSAWQKSPDYVHEVFGDCYRQVRRVLDRGIVAARARADLQTVALANPAEGVRLLNRARRQEDQATRLFNRSAKVYNDDLDEAQKYLDAL